MQLISIDQRDLFSKVKFDPVARRYVSHKRIHSESTTIYDLEAVDIHYWPEENEGRDLLPGFALFEVTEYGLLKLVREEPLHA